MARRSARISNRSSSTPQPIKRVSLSHDAFPIAPRTVPAKLSSLLETEEMPGSFPDSPTSSFLAQPNKRQRTMPGTPERASILPAKEEMHPQAAHQSTAKADEEARYLGFSAMPKSNESPLPSTLYPALSTPTHTAQKLDIAAQSPTFKFTFQREQSLELSPAAKSLMQEKRAEAAKIKEQMKGTVVKESIADGIARKIATPRSQRSRFSDAHNAQFDKMDSISAHASAYRTDPARRKPLTSTSKATTPSASRLPQSPSKNNLLTSASTPSRTPATSNLKRKADVQLTRLSSEQEKESSIDATTSTRKRVKIATPSQIAHFKHTPAKISTTTTSGLGTPTKPALVTSNSTKASGGATTRIPAPITVATPEKSAAVRSLTHSDDTPLLKRTPARAPIASLLKQTTKTSGQESPLIGLLDRSPVRRATHAVDTKETEKPVVKTTPIRPTTDAGNPFKTETPLQARYTLGSANLLGRFEQLRSTPVKSILRTPQRLYSDDPAKVAAGTHLATPPQVKGRRMPATAPVRKQVDFSSSTKAREDIKHASVSPYTFVAPPKKVATPATPTVASTIAYPQIDATPAEETLSVQKRRQSSGPRDFTFRVGSEIVFGPATTPTKVGTPRAVSAYTIRHVPAEPEHPAAPSTVNAMKQRKIQFEDALSTSAATMSPTMTLGSKKRKFDFENGVAEMEADKENVPAADDDGTDDQRPSKRMKQSAPSPRVIKGAKTVPRLPYTGQTKRPTLGVKPKAAVGKPAEKVVKRPGTTISMARLNALAQPKKR